MLDSIDHRVEHLTPSSIEVGVETATKRLLTSDVRFMNASSSDLFRVKQRLFSYQATTVFVSSSDTAAYQAATVSVSSSDTAAYQAATLFTAAVSVAGPSTRCLCC